jgi:CDGSH iron-sulfur domain-containing protein 1
MPRLVRHELNGPIKIEPQEKPVWVCGCGLSAKFPICDGTHKGCVNEPVGVVSVYSADRRTIIETRPDEPAPAPSEHLPRRTSGRGPSLSSDETVPGLPRRRDVLG